MTRPRRPPRPTEGSTKTGALAADLLQVQPLATIDAIHDCRLGKPAAEPRMTETRREIALSPRNACFGGRPWAFYAWAPQLDRAIRFCNPGARQLQPGATGR